MDGAARCQWLERRATRHARLHVEPVLVVGSGTTLMGARAGF
jgi:hypothetical protein